MSKLKKIRSGNFTLISNAIFEDWRLSYKEIGLYCNMMMYPDDWDFSIRYLADKHKDKRDAVRSGIEKLIQYGYVSRSEKQHRDDKGYYGKYDYIIYEDPHDNSLYIPCPKQESDQDCSPPCTDFPYTDNPTADSEPCTDFPLTDNQTTEAERCTDFPTTADPLTDYPTAGFPNTDNPTTNNTILSNTINTNTIRTKYCDEDDDRRVRTRECVDIDLFKKKLTNSYLNTYFTNLGKDDKQEQLNQAYNAIINALPDIKDPVAVKAINGCSSESAGDLLKKVYVEMFSKQLGYVVRNDIVDKHAYLVKFIASQMKAAYGENPLTYYGIRV